MLTETLDQRVAATAVADRFQHLQDTICTALETAASLKTNNVDKPALNMARHCFGSCLTN